MGSRSANHRGERGRRPTPASELAPKNKTATCPPNILIFFTSSYSKWWIKQTETAACVQPNPAALRGVGSSWQAPPHKSHERRTVALLFSYWLVWTTETIPIGAYACSSKHFLSYRPPPPLAGSVEPALLRKQKEALRLDANIHSKESPMTITQHCKYGLKLMSTPCKYNERMWNNSGNGSKGSGFANSETSLLHLAVCCRKCREQTLACIRPWGKLNAWGSRMH